MITKIQRALINLAAVSLGTEKLELTDLNTTDWKELYDLAGWQGMLTILFPMIEKLPLEFQPELEIFQIWQQTVLKLIYRRFLYVQNVYGTLESIKKANIPVVILKGLAIARFYEKPEFRLSSDLDILVKDEFILHARQTIEEMGYIFDESEQDSILHFEYHKKNNVTIELHSTLVHSGFLGHRNLDNWFKHIWANTQIISSEGIKFTAMASEDELINQVIHFASHMVYMGTRLSHIYDMALIINYDGNLDWGYMEKILKSIGFYDFAQLLFACCAILFHVEIPKKFIDVKLINPEQFIDDFLNEYSVIESLENLTGWLAIVCRFPILYRQPVMLPVALLVEYMAQFKIHGFSKIRLVFQNAKRNNKRFRKKVWLFKNFGLSF